jgi:molybdopterin-guanine dinucleotide biosynthesis protein A
MKNRNNDITTALIVGGKSRRFGTLKQLAIWDQQSLLDHSLHLARQLTNSIIAITGPHTFDLPDDIPQYNDLVKDKGPMGGILTALQYCRTSWCIMIPCDMPLLNVEIYHALIEALPSNVPIVAQSHRGVEPLVSIWPKSLLTDVKQAIQQNKLKLYLLINELNARIIPLEKKIKTYNPLFFSNINTKDDLEKLRHNYGK